MEWNGTEWNGGEGLMNERKRDVACYNLNYPVWDRRRMTKGAIDYYPSIDA